MFDYRTQSALNRDWIRLSSITERSIDYAGRKGNDDSCASTLEHKMGKLKYHYSQNEITVANNSLTKGPLFKKRACSYRSVTEVVTMSKKELLRDREAHTEKPISISQERMYLSSRV